MNDRETLFEFVIRLADNAVVLGQRLGEQIAAGPELEEEMATANFALDYIGQARMLYTYAGEIEGKGRDEDSLAFLRDVTAYRNVLLAEQPNGDFAHTTVRQFLFETVYLLRLDALTSSSDQRLADIAARATKEIRYHLRHHRNWLVRLGDGTDESHRRCQAALNEMWRFTGELFIDDAVDQWAAQHGVAALPSSHRPDWDAAVDDALAEATLSRPEDEAVIEGGRQGRHTEHLGYLLADMQFLQRAYPGASW